MAQPYQEQPTVELNQTPQPVLTTTAPVPFNDGNPLYYISTQSSNSQQYPESSALYETMVRQFGANNIKSIPDFLNTDKIRKRWLKSNENATLYFILRRDHYKKKLQKLYDEGTCGGCYQKAHELYGTKSGLRPNLNEFEIPNGNSMSGAEGMCCIFCWCCNCSLYMKDFEMLLYSKNNENEPTCCTCCTFCSGGMEFYKETTAEFKRIGINVKEDETDCHICCKLCCCLPCVSAHLGNVIYYTYYKRYGLPLHNIGLDWQNESQDYYDYMMALQTLDNHPYSKSVRKYEPGTRHWINERQRPIKPQTTIHDLFAPYYDVKQCVEKHNEYWKTFHAISMEGDFNA